MNTIYRGNKFHPMVVYLLAGKCVMHSIIFIF